MDYRLLPNTPLKVSSLCLGTGDLGGAIPPEMSYRMLDAYTSQGGNFIDTAKVYSDWREGERSVSEKTIGRWLRARGCRDRVILATKGAHPDLETMHLPRLAREDILADLEASLRHLQTDWIDLYWLHRDDPARPVGEIMDTLNDAVRSGKIRCFGCSNWHRERIQAANTFAVDQGLQGFAADQMLWNLAAVEPASVNDPTIVVMDAELYDYHRQTGLAAVPFSSQANGYFHKMAQGNVDRLGPAQQKMYATPENLRRFQRAQQLAQTTGLSISQVILGYLISQPFPTIPIIGPHSLEQLDDSLRAGAVRLTPEQVQFLAGGGSR